MHPAPGHQLATSFLPTPGNHEEEGGLAHPHAGGKLRQDAPPLAVCDHWGQGARPGGQPALHAFQGSSQGQAQCVVVLQEGAAPKQVRVYRMVTKANSGGYALAHAWPAADLVLCRTNLQIFVLVQSRQEAHAPDKEDGAERTAGPREGGSFCAVCGINSD
eukprot:1161671-Pelagomonas_calceolata.AAC.10